MAAILPLEGRGGLSGDLGALLESKEAADVTLEVSGSQLLAHRAILTARSPVFRAKLRDIAKESGSFAVQISDMKDEVMKQLLCFMYTDQVPDLCTYAAPLLVAADEYGIPLLKQVCEAMLAKGITVTNASEMAVLAVKHSCTKLKEVTINFIRTHNEVLGTNGWEDAILKHPRTVAQICRLMVAKPSEKSKEQLLSPDTLPSRGHLEEDMAVLLESGEAADVTLRVGKLGARMAAHRALLVARCPTLAAKQHIESTEPSVLTQVLRFLYTGRVALEVGSAVCQLHKTAVEPLAFGSRVVIRLPRLCQPKIPTKHVRHNHPVAHSSRETTLRNLPHLKKRYHSQDPTRWRRLPHLMASSLPCAARQQTR
ncbi:uncharacterized protein LOC126458259 isoform X5 [Schistocerca serialis cubense]|uniref:uncharacterized protein LOC126458259 isoform X5 n=1 Tax=Schistocerca serialis cubense TaxID=2023355 RepID=UPI00214E4CAF|nr:uncharacterized protein LOC126458259 isoform X5 [Schistocerca serialis cubense]